MKENALFFESNERWRNIFLIFAIIFTMGIISNLGFLIQDLLEYGNLQSYDAIRSLGICVTMAILLWIVCFTSKKLKATFTITHDEIKFNKQQQIHGMNSFSTTDFKSHEVVKAFGKATTVKFLFTSNKNFQITTRKYSKLKFVLEFLEMRNQAQMQANQTPKDDM